MMLEDKQQALAECLTLEQNITTLNAMFVDAQAEQQNLVAEINALRDVLAQAFAHQWPPLTLVEV